MNAMNDSVTKPTADQPNALRRRLAKGGLAAPVILATLASKPVLGTDVPWNCTLSGQLSGNASGKTEESCNTIGKGQNAWFSNPYPFDDTKTLTDWGVTNHFYMTGTDPAATLTSTVTGTVANLHQILDSALATPSGLEYERKAVVLLLNAKNNTDPSNNYPLTEGQAKGLFEAVASGGTFTDTDPGFTWSNAKVKSYIDLLYH
jgi:hypothetical protein